MKRERQLLLAGLIFFMVSLFLPAIVFTTGETMWGWYAFLFGWMAIIWGFQAPAWIANMLIFFAFAIALARNYKVALGFSLSAFIIGLHTFFMRQLCTDGCLQVAFLGVGFYIWMLSFIIVSFSCIWAMKRKNLPPEAGQESRPEYKEPLSESASASKNIHNYSFMDYYVQPFRKYAAFGGRTTRKEYWMFFLWQAAIMLVLFFFTGFPGVSQVSFLISFLYGFASIVPNFAITLRRLHDTNHSGWWCFINCIPLLGFIIFLALLCQGSQIGSNAYGPNPNEGGFIVNYSETQSRIE